MGKLNELLGAVEVKLEGLLVRAVIHDGREAGLDALEAVLVRTVIEVKGDGNGNARASTAALTMSAQTLKPPIHLAAPAVH